MVAGSLVAGALAAASGTAPAGASGGLTASAPGVTPTTITIGLPVAETGPAASTFETAPIGAQARVAYQNAHGGVDGRKLVLDIVDDQTNPSLIVAGTKDLLSKPAFGIVAFDSFFFNVAPYLQSQGVPVTGLALDGIEWGQHPYTNMFSYNGSYDSKQPVYAYGGKFLKSRGVTKFAVLAYNVSKTSTAAATGYAFSAKHAGIAVPYENLSIPFGSSDFTSVALAMKADGINGLYAGLVESSDIGLLTSLRDAGITLKAVVLSTGYGQQILEQPDADAAAQGAFFTSLTVPIENHSPATVAWLNAMAKYSNGAYRAGTVPDFGETGAWLSVDAMIYGLQHAGKNPTRASFEKAMETTTDYTAGGLLTAPASWAHFGTFPPTSCASLEQLEGKHFVPTPVVCGNLLPNSDQLP